MRRQRGVKACVLQQGMQRLHTFCHHARRLANDQTVAKVMLHFCRTAQRAARMHHTADEVLRGNGLCDAPLGVHAGQWRVGVRPPKAL